MDWKAWRRYAKKTVDGVMVDWVMPSMNGKVLAQSIKQVSEKTPVIMLTAFGDIMEEEHDHPGGIDLILPKPVTGNELQQAITTVIAKQA